MNFVFNIKPISVNNLIRYNSKTHKAYRVPLYINFLDTIRKQLKEKYNEKPINYEVSLIVGFYIQKDQDVDNMIKSFLDAISGFNFLLENDKIIRQITATKYKIGKTDSPKITLNICKYSD